MIEGLNEVDSIEPSLGAHLNCGRGVNRCLYDELLFGLELLQCIVVELSICADIRRSSVQIPCRLDNIAELILPLYRPRLVHACAVNRVWYRHPYHLRN